MKFYADFSRASLEGDVLKGYAVVYNEPTQGPVELLGEVLPAGAEEVERGALDGLDLSSVVATVDHDPSRRLGSTDDGSVRLSLDEKGLAYEIDLDSDLGREVRRGVESGRYRGASFTATIGRMVRAGGRVVHQKFAALREISVVGRPAYAGAIAREAAHQSVREQLIRARHRVLMEREGK